MVNDIQYVLLSKVTPARCRLSWSWRKRCASTNSTKTQSSLSTVSLAAFHTDVFFLEQHIQFQHLTHRMFLFTVTVRCWFSPGAWTWRGPNVKPLICDSLLSRCSTHLVCWACCISLSVLIDLQYSSRVEAQHHNWRLVPTQIILTVVPDTQPDLLVVSCLPVGVINA